jgi:hypothetical protein
VIKAYRIKPRLFLKRFWVLVLVIAIFGFGFPIAQLTLQKVTSSNFGSCTIPPPSDSVFEVTLNLIRQKCSLKIEIEQKKPLTPIESKVAQLRIVEVIRHNNLVSDSLPFAKINRVTIYQNTTHRRADSNAAATYAGWSGNIVFHGPSDLINTTHELYHGLQRGVGYDLQFYDHTIGSKHFNLDPWITNYIFGPQVKLGLSKALSDQESYERFGTVFFSKNHKVGKNNVGHLELGSYLTSQFAILPKVTNPNTLNNLARLVIATSIATKQDYYSSPQIQEYYLEMGKIQQYVTSSKLFETLTERTINQQEQIDSTLKTLTMMYNNIATINANTTVDRNYSKLKINLAMQLFLFGLYLTLSKVLLTKLVRILFLRKKTNKKKH